MMKVQRVFSRSHMSGSSTEVLLSYESHTHSGSKINRNCIYIRGRFRGMY